MEIMEKGFVRYPIRMTFSTLSAVEKKGGGNDRTPVQSKRSWRHESHQKHTTLVPNTGLCF